jgi:Reverse transcriptase (RNA-dependent DNA polymerase)
MGYGGYKTEIGIPQGLLTSPMLFNIYMEPLINSLTEQGLIVIAYADDIALVLKDKSDLNKALEIIEGWSSRNNMEINKNKSGILKFGGFRSKLRELKGYPVVNKYKYLGIRLNRKEVLSNLLSQVNDAIRNKVLATRPIISTLPLDKRMMIVRCLLLAELDQFGPVFVILGKYAIKQVEEITRGAVRSLLDIEDNDKNDRLVDLVLKIDREIIWKKRLDKIVQDWGTKGLKWEIPTQSEPVEQDLKEEKVSVFPKDTTPNIISLISHFNNTECSEHKLPCTSEHLWEGHGVWLNEAIITTMVVIDHGGTRNKYIKYYLDQLLTIIEENRPLTIRSVDKQDILLNLET